MTESKKTIHFPHLPRLPGGAEGIAACTQRQLKEIIADDPVGALLTFVDAVKSNNTTWTILLAVAKLIHRCSVGRRANDRAVGRNLAINPRCKHGCKGKLIEGAAKRAHVICGVVFEQQRQDRFRIKVGAGVKEEPRQKVEDVACKRK